MLSSIISLTERYYEGSHARFVAEKSAMVATALKLPEEEVYEIKVAALLHDIGKIGIKDSYVYKFTSEMNETEYQNYILHPQIGWHILSKYDAFKTIAEIVLQHHEKLDGSGFPGRLRGSDIHTGAKIIAVVDYFHNSLYKNLRSRQGVVPFTSTSNFMESTKDKFYSSIAYLDQKKGFYFDPAIVEKFTEIMSNEREGISARTVNRIHINAIEPGMVFAEDYFTSYGLLIAAKGETTTPDLLRAMRRFAEAGELPFKLLMVH